MPVDPMIARPYVAQFGNTLGEIARTKVADDYRSALMQQRRDELAYEQQQAAAASAAEDEDDREWDEAYAARNWGVMARIDPQTTRALMEYEREQKSPAAYSITEQAGPFGSRIVSDGSRFQVVEPQSTTTDSDKRTADQRTYEWFARLSPEGKAEFLRMKRANATPEAAAATEAAKIGARESEKARVAAVADLPRVEANATDMLAALDALDQSPGFGRLWGAYSLAPIVPGTDQADAFAIWEQIQGKAFLEAFNTLKGGGQITEKEGAKATAAITRLAQRKQSADGARAAIRDLRGVVSAAVARAQSKARSAPPAAPAAPAVRRFNPETGRIE